VELIKVGHEMKSMIFLINFDYQFRGSQTSLFSESQIICLIPAQTVEGDQALTCIDREIFAFFKHLTAAISENNTMAFPICNGECV
jgi:hypothetical protein